MQRHCCGIGLLNVSPTFDFCDKKMRSTVTIDKMAVF